MQLICVDEQSFAKIRAQSGIYVDKTQHLYNIFKTGTYFFISRPRRFGKSLLCSTIAELFAGNRELFKNTWIDQSDWNWQEHPVIRLDMTKAAGASSDAAIVRQGMLNLINDNATQLGIVDLAQTSPHLMLAQLINKLHLKNGKGVVVVIDEYDKPLLDTVDDSNRYKDIHRELASFYGQLKASSDQLRLVFLTGVFKFAQTSIFSGLNNLNDLTFNPKAAEMLGYTEQEIKTYFAEHLDALAKKDSVSTDAMLDTLRQQYNGYRFGVDLMTEKLSSRVYNPFGLNYVFKEQQLMSQWFSSGSPSALIKKLSEQGFQAIETKNMIMDFSTLKNSCGPDNMDPVMLLYYAGYTTIKSFERTTPGDGEVVLGFPNMETGLSFSKLLLPLITKTDDNAMRNANKELRKIVLANNLDALKDCMNHLLAQLPYELHGKQGKTEKEDLVLREHYYQTVFYLWLTAAGFLTTPEDMTNRGRIDLTVLLPNTVYIFELKMDQPAAAAIQQIKDRDYATKYRTPGRHIVGVGITLNVKDRCVDELLYEIL